MQIDKITVSYCTNYNGVNIILNDEDNPSDYGKTVAKKFDNLAEQIATALVDDCDEDGEYMGTKVQATNIIARIVGEAIDDKVELVVEFDDFST